jgi:hypothetical protein
MNGLNRGRLIVFGVFILAISTVLLYWIRPVIREMIVIPLSYWYWVIGLFLESTPQFYFWIVTLLFVFLIAWRSFMVKEKSNEVVEKVPDYPPPSGRVTYWHTRVELMRMGTYYQTTFNEAMGRLALDLIGYRHRISNRQIERGLARNSLRLPDEVRDFLIKNVFQREYLPVPFHIYLYRAARLWILSRFKKDRPNRNQIAADARRLIQYMEEELEVNYDHPGR